MTDFDLDRLGDVWRQQPDPAEMARLQRSASAVARRARWGQIFDIGAAIAVAGVVLLLVLSNPRIEAVGMGAAAILFLLVSNIRLRRLRLVELRSLTGTTEDMLDQSIERVEKTIRHNRFSLFAIGPGLIVGALVAAAAVGRHENVSVFGALHDVFGLRYLWRGFIIAALIGGVLFIAFAIRRGRRELERLVTMRECYRQEHDSTAP